MASQSALTAAVNTLLASGQPITASIHRNAAGQLIAELYDANSRGAVIAQVSTAADVEEGDEVLIVRDGALRRIDKSVFSGINGGTP